MPPGPTIVGPGGVAVLTLMHLRFVLAFLAFPLLAAAQSSSGSEIWPDLGAQLQFPVAFRLVFEGQLKEGLSYDATQWIFGAAIGYQWQRIRGRHIKNINEDKEHHLLLGIGYQYLQTDEPTPQKFENRLVLDATFYFRPGEPLLIGDRNRYEYRWVNGTYSTEYRNMISFEYDLTKSERPIRPYVSAEFYYDVTKSDWAQEQYAAGVEWPVGVLTRLKTYYLWQTCDGCSPRHLNVIGVALDLYGTLR